MWHSRFRAILTTGTLSIFKKSKQTKNFKMEHALWSRHYITFYCLLTGGYNWEPERKTQHLFFASKIMLWLVYLQFL